MEGTWAIAGPRWRRVTKRARYAPLPQPQSTTPLMLIETGKVESPAGKVDPGLLKSLGRLAGGQVRLRRVLDLSEIRTGDAQGTVVRPGEPQYWLSHELGPLAVRCCSPSAGWQAWTPGSGCHPPASWDHGRATPGRYPPPSPWPAPKRRLGAPFSAPQDYLAVGD